jgi:hypothetical protein
MAEQMYRTPFRSAILFLYEAGGNDHVRCQEVAMVMVVRPHLPAASGEWEEVEP